MNVWMKTLALCHWPTLGIRVEMWAVPCSISCSVLCKGDESWAGRMRCFSQQENPHLLCFILHTLSRAGCS